MIKRLILKIIKFYQFFISPGLGHYCRFYPNCSQYLYLSIEKYGLGKGLWRGFVRVLKCNRWNKGGVDMP